MTAGAIALAIIAPAVPAHSGPLAVTPAPSRPIAPVMTTHALKRHVPVADVTVIRRELTRQKLTQSKSRASGRLARPSSRPTSPTNPTRPVHYSNWLVVARCESSGNWSINTGNGYYGGLQFSQGTWDSFDRPWHFAARADLATELQQMTVAEHVLAVQGPGAWPVCSQGAF